MIFKGQTLLTIPIFDFYSSELPPLYFTNLETIVNDKALCLMIMHGNLNTITQNKAYQRFLTTAGVMLK